MISHQKKNTKLKIKEVLEFPPEKDYTDTEIALMEAAKRGAEKIYRYYFVEKVIETTGLTYTKENAENDDFVFDKDNINISLVWSE